MSFAHKLHNPQYTRGLSFAPTLHMTPSAAPFSVFLFLYFYFLDHKCEFLVQLN